MTSAAGAMLTLADGRTLIDGVGSWWVSALGHNHPRVVEALEAQLRTMAHVALAGLTHEPAARLAARLAALAPPGLTRVFYSDNGSTAVEVAIRAAFQWQQQRGDVRRRVFVSFEGAYHGDTIGAVSVGGIDEFHARFGPLLFETARVRGPGGNAQHWEASLAALSDVLQRRGDEIAAVVIEPLVQGAAGMLMHPPELVRRVRELCDSVGALLIADEVFVGFGRTGTLFACEQAGVTPDLMCLSKGLTGGALPFAATLATEAVYDGFRGARDRMFYYGHSYCGNPLGCAAAHGALDAFEQDDVLGAAQARAAELESGLAVLATLPGVSSVRRTGLIGAVQLGHESRYGDDVGWRVYQAALRSGAYLRPLGNVVYFVPALTIPAATLGTLLEIAEGAIREAVG